MHVHYSCAAYDLRKMEYRDNKRVKATTLCAVVLPAYL